MNIPLYQKNVGHLTSFKEFTINSLSLFPRGLVVLWGVVVTGSLSAVVCNDCDWCRIYLSHHPTTYYVIHYLSCKVWFMIVNLHSLGHFQAAGFTVWVEFQTQPLSAFCQMTFEYTTKGTVDLTHLVECLPSMREALGSLSSTNQAWWHTPVALASGRQEEGDQDSRSFWAIYQILRSASNLWDPVLTVSNVVIKNNEGFFLFWKSSPHAASEQFSDSPRVFHGTPHAPTVRWEAFL